MLLSKNVIFDNKLKGEYKNHKILLIFLKDDPPFCEIVSVHESCLCLACVPLILSCQALKFKFSLNRF